MARSGSTAKRVRGKPGPGTAGRPATKAAPDRARRAPVQRAEAKRARTSAPGVAAIHARLRELCLTLPETTEVEAWGHPTFRVAGKIFVGFSGTDEGGASLGVKTTHELQAALVSSDPRFTIAAYVGKHGWISMAIAPGARIDWNEIEVLVHGSYRLVAPAKLAATVPAP